MLNHSPLDFGRICTQDAQGISSARGSHDSSMPDEFVTLLAGVPTKEVIVLTTTFFTSTFSAPNPHTFTQHIDKHLARNQS